MAEAAGPGPSNTPERRPARCGPAAIPGRPGIPFLSLRDWLLPSLPSKMAPFPQLWGFGSSRPWSRVGCREFGDPVCQGWGQFWDPDKMT